MTEDLITADDLARELGKHPADLYEQVILGTMPEPYWRRADLIEWVAHYRGTDGEARHE